VKGTSAAGDKSESEGGLFILGTERHESRRIDRQLRGRAGRQGDPGTSQFYLSLEDDLMRLFGSDRIARVMDRLGAKEGEVITHGLITSAIGRAQQRVEAYNFSIRKHLLEYDDVMNQQRSVVYTRRNIALRGEDPTPLVTEMIEDGVDYLLEKHREGEDSKEINTDALAESVMRTFLVDLTGDDSWRAMNEDQLRSMILEHVEEARQLRTQFLGDDMFKSLQRFAILRVIDVKWRDHLYAMDGLKEGVSLRAFGQKDPLIEYKKEGFDLFQSMLDEVNADALRIMFSWAPPQSEQTAAQVQAPTVRRVSQTPAMTYSHADSAGLAYAKAVQGGGEHAAGAGVPDAATQAPAAGKQQPVRVEPTVGRNDLCPCGSGKKYKKCHGATVPNQQ
jgi:preprotein translocase subunit SecA